MSKRKVIPICAGIGVIIIVLIAVLLRSNSSTQAVSGNLTIKNIPKGVFIAEVMSNNHKTYVDSNGDAPSYVKLYNNSKKAVSLSGYYISDDENDLQKCALPDVTIQPNDFFTMYSKVSTVDETSENEETSDSEETSETEIETEEVTTIGASNGDEDYYLNFRISTTGDTLYLTSPKGKTTTVTIPELPSDISYGIPFYTNSSDYEYFLGGSVGEVNNFEHSETLSDIYTAPQYNLSITEYMSSNRSKVVDNYGKTSNWIEIYNGGTEEVDLSGMVLSDNPAKPSKWTFPDGVTIGADEYLVVWLDKLDEYEDGELHASFKLGENDDHLVLTDTNYTVVFEADVKYVDKDVSIGVDEEGNELYYSVPTPGEANGNGYETLEEATSLDLKDVYISEVSAFSSGGDTEDLDWIELYNSSNKDISLDGWQISKKFTDDDPYTFTDVTIEAGQYLILYAMGDDEEDYDTDSDDNYYTHDSSGNRVYLDSNAVYLPFKIGSDGEKLYLFNKSGECVDYFKSGWTIEGNTCGRSGNIDETVYYATPTPGEVNAEVSYKGYTSLDDFELSNVGGYAEDGERLTAEIPEGITVRYTTDGSEPTEDSKEFNAYTISDNCVLRFKLYQDGYLPSIITSSTYIVSETHDIPFIAISTDADNLFSNSSGILAYGSNYSSDYPYHGANFWQDWEREISFEYYTADGEKEVSCLAGTKVFGQYSRANDQKSLAIYFRGKYGTSSVDYKFFEDDDVTEFSSLVLRAGGQDQKYTRIRDALTAEVESQCTDLAHMEWEPVAVYINGEYWGFFDLREKINAEWFEQHEDIDSEDLSLLKGGGSVRQGSSDSYRELLNYIQNNDLSVQENYDHVAELMDVDNFTDYLLAEIFFANTDSGNIKFYVDESGGKWRWVLFDLDMSLRPSCVQKGGFNSIEEMFDPAGHGANNMFTTIIQRKLIQNEGFREKFISRYAELLNTYYQPENLLETFNSMVSRMDSEMVLHGARWEYPTYEKWLKNVDEMREILEVRRDVAKVQMIDFFDLSDDEVAELFPDDEPITDKNSVYLNASND